MGTSAFRQTSASVHFVPCFTGRTATTGLLRPEYTSRSFTATAVTMFWS